MAPRLTRMIVHKTSHKDRSSTILASQIDPPGSSHSAPPNAPPNAPQSKRELLYGPLPRAGDNNYEEAIAKRNEAAGRRRRYSTCNEAAGETQRAIPCARCARHLADWEGPDEGPRPICVDGASGSTKCTRCSSDSSKKPCVEVTGAARAMVRALEDVAQKVSSDADLPLLHSSQLSVKKAFQQATAASKLPAILQEKADREKQEYKDERRLLAAEMQAKATSDMASSITRLADIIERGFARLQPVVAAGLSEDALDGDEDSDSVY
ncbi:uncharacterized protein DNG_07831 [Cephalotrichum gorgonifer]|uniref:Uncharacterized protein n=1 Tax=Cephalotrichum gorgonifer TaxID=2041049 RepID=A0AAE8SXS7_9PEZI|nr:uncharacterized protein DNG_07831 [Cephalotrichum gorgonifer]